LPLAWHIDPRQAQAAVPAGEAELLVDVRSEVLMAQDTGYRRSSLSPSTGTLDRPAGEHGEGLLPAANPLVLGLGDPPIVLRPEREQDTAFLANLFRDTAGRDISLMAIDEAMKDALIRMQFTSQAATYRAQFPSARFDIIEQGGAPIGRIVIDPGTEAGRIVDIALMPQRRARGLGTAILAAVLDRFAGRRQRVLCQVLANNEPSLRMCHRVGFRQVSEAPPFLHLEWRPSRDSHE
jgi:RimJ/RimL family protein N-acetyltransferase